MFDDDIVDATIGLLVCEDLFVYRPGQWLVDEVLEVCDLCYRTCVSGVVRVDDSNIVSFCQTLEVVKEVFDLLEVLLLLGRGLRKQTRKTVDHDHSQIKLHLLVLHLGQDHRH